MYTLWTSLDSLTENIQNGNHGDRQTVETVDWNNKTDDKEWEGGVLGDKLDENRLLKYEG